MKHAQKRRTVLFLLILALLAGSLWYARPVGLDTLYPNLEPDLIDVTLIQFNGHGHTDRSLRLTPEDPEFAPLLRRLEALRFRRSPTNLLLQAMPFLQDLLPAAVKTTGDGEIQHLIIGLAEDTGTDAWRHADLQFRIDRWSYRDFEHGVSLPLFSKDGKTAGQALAQELWDLSLDFSARLESDS